MMVAFIGRMVTACARCVFRLSQTTCTVPDGYARATSSMNATKSACVRRSLRTHSSLGRTPPLLSTAASGALCDRGSSSVTVVPLPTVLVSVTRPSTGPYFITTNPADVARWSRTASREASLKLTVIFSDGLVEGCDAAGWVPAGWVPAG